MTSDTATTQMVISPDSDFFRFFDSPAGRGQSTRELPLPIDPEGPMSEAPALPQAPTADATGSLAPLAAPVE
jgi:membrane protease subunit HflC